MRNKKGNAADAAISVALCESILNPNHSGLGGGGFVVVRFPNGTAVAINGREAAPSAASQDMFGGEPMYSILGAKSIAIPSWLKALDRLRSVAGKLPWSDLVEPIIPLARDGFAASPYHVGVTTIALPWLASFPQAGMTFLIKTEDGRYRVPKVGEVCCQRPQLAELLEKIGAQGADALYNHATAKKLADEISQLGGVITADDIMSYTVLEKEPYTIQVLGHELLTMDLPSAGPLIPLGLQILEQFEWEGVDEGLEVHRLIEVLRQMFALRLHMGDVLTSSHDEDSDVVLDTTTLMK